MIEEGLSKVKSEWLIEGKLEERRLEYSSRISRLKKINLNSNLLDYWITNF